MNSINRIRVKFTAITFTLLVGLAFSADRNPTKPSQLAGNHPIIIGGTASVVGQWSCGADIDIQAVPDPSEPIAPGLSTGVQIAAVASVPAIDCGDSTMNKHMRKALKDTAFPEIRFKSDKYTLINNGQEVRTSGELTIAGVTRPIELTAKLTPLSGGGIRAEGKVSINMEDFGVKPPSLFLGTMKVAKAVTISFDTSVKLHDQTTQ